MRIMISASSGVSLINFRGKLIREMVKRGHEVICTSIEPVEEMEEEIAALGAKYLCIPGTRTGTGIWEALKMIYYYILVFRKWKPDLCFLYMSKPVAFGGLAAVLCKVKRITVFVTGLEIVFYTPGIKNRLIRLLLILLFKITHSHSETVFFMNSHDYEKMKGWRLVKEGQGVIVPGSGVDMEHFKQRPVGAKSKVCMTARLLWSKGVREYIQAAAIVKQEYPEVSFLLIGDYDENPESMSREEIQEAVADGKIIYCGFAKDVRPYLEDCSIYVLPSYHEGNGKSIVEAEAVGRAIITTKAPGCSETVIDGYNGFLIPVKDPYTMADRIIMLLEHEEVIDRMAGFSHQLCDEKFDVNKINRVFIQRLKL